MAWQQIGWQRQWPYKVSWKWCQMVRQCNIVLDDGKWLVYGLDKDMASCCSKMMMGKASVLILSHTLMVAPHCSAHDKNEANVITQWWQSSCYFVVIPTSRDEYSPSYREKTNIGPYFSDSGSIHLRGRECTSILGLKNNIFTFLPVLRAKIKCKSTTSH